MNIAIFLIALLVVTFCVRISSEILPIVFKQKTEISVENILTDNHLHNSLLVTRTSRTFFLNRPIVKKYYIQDKNDILNNTYDAETGNQIEYERHHLYSRENLFLQNLRIEILASQNKIKIDSIIDTHYNKLIETIDSELDIKFKALEKQSLDAKKIKARISDFETVESKHQAVRELISEGYELAASYKNGNKHG